MAEKKRPKTGDDSDVSKGESRSPVARPPKTQFPHDPDRASEAGFTYGEAAPEKPGRQMRTPPVIPEPAPPSAGEIEQQKETTKERAEENKRQQLESDLEEVAEKIGPRGNYRR
jgi:hypothetical protein